MKTHTLNVAGLTPEQITTLEAVAADMRGEPTETLHNEKLSDCP